MKLGIMQPYFFPYLGYFDLINRTDKWVVFDIVQYQNKSWMSRNRVHHPNNGWQYISAPVEKHSRSTLIKDIHIKDAEDIKKKLIGQLEHYKNRAPYYENVCQIIMNVFDSAQGGSLIDLNIKTILAICDYLDIAIDYSICSEMDLEIPKINYPGQWALEIATALNAKEYINPPNGKNIFRIDEFQQRNIKLTFTSLINFKYNCEPYEEIEHLSVIDLIMFCSPKKIKQYLDDLK